MATDSKSWGSDQSAWTKSADKSTDKATTWHGDSKETFLGKQDSGVQTMQQGATMTDAYISTNQPATTPTQKVVSSPSTSAKYARFEMSPRGAVQVTDYVKEASKEESETEKTPEGVAYFYEVTKNPHSIKGFDEWYHEYKSTYRALYENPGITIEELARKTNMDEDTVNEKLVTLTDYGFVKAGTEKIRGVEVVESKVPRDTRYSNEYYNIKSRSERKNVSVEQSDLSKGESWLEASSKTKKQSETNPILSVFNM